MLKALVPVDGSENALNAVRHVIKLMRDGEPFELHLLNVQPLLHKNVTSHVPHQVVQDYHREEADKALKSACDLLHGAGVPYQSHILVGHAAAVIAEQARTLGCDQVVMGTRGLGSLTQILLGSVSNETIQLMDPKIPITLVKAGYASSS